ncbi:MAG TPA: enoyl-CoA hydratase-related protein, partial [Acidimicrobiales bacterium]
MIHVEARDAVVLATIDRPERRNAVDHAALVGLKDALEHARDEHARVLILTGANGTFCAGADLTGVEGGAFAAALTAVLTGLTELPAVTIAAVEGPALGAGTQLAAACDLRVAHKAARFGVPAARLGLAVDQWTVDRLVALVGGGTARAILLAAESISGADALRLGFVQRLGGLGDAQAWADEIVELAPLTIAAHKVALEHPDDADV